MTKKEKLDLQKKALEQLRSGESLFGKNGAFASFHFSKFKHSERSVPK